MEPLYDKKLKFLTEMSVILRQDVIKMLAEAGSGHSAGPLGMADIFTALYFHILNHNPKKPNWPDRDRLVLSNGHICPILYAALARAGYFKESELKTLRKLGSRLQGHPHRSALPGLESTSGPLGSGLSQAIGMSLAARLDHNGSTTLTTSGSATLTTSGSKGASRGKHRIYCLLSDGEHQEGNHWEAVMFAGKNRLNNLVAIIDRNNIQIDGHTEDVMPLEPLRLKYEAFNWHTLEIDGHSFEQIIAATSEAKAIYEKPTVIIAHTIPGRGVDFMENNYLWHGMPPGISDVPGAPPKAEQAKVALHELRTMGGKISSEHQ
ncbi:MAG: transketolase [Patescibacteria group bacterium]